MLLPPRLAVPFAVLAWCGCAIAALVVVAGAVAVPAIALSISDSSRLLVASCAFAVGAVLAAGGPVRALDALASTRAPYLATLLIVLAAVLAVQATRGATSVGGADSAGYLMQAQRWRAGALHVPLPLTVPGMSNPWHQSSLGFRPDATNRATVPSYPPGLPWIEAVALQFGGEAGAVRAIPAISAAVALLALFVVALPRAGYAGAALASASLASLPPFLFQALQPMSDVPALAAWLAALALAGRPSTPALAGSALAALVAILIRPNLAPLVLAVMWQAWLPAGSARAGLRRTLLIAAAAAIGVGIVAWVQAYLYGSPLQSGYGQAHELFAAAHVPQNIRLYAAWLRQGIAWPALALITGGGVLLVASAVRHPHWRPALLMSALTVALYLIYIPFDSWTYLRFVLVPLALAPLGVAETVGRLRHTRMARWTFPIAAGLILLLTLPNVQRARNLAVFSFWSSEHRYKAAGEFVRDSLPATAVILAGQHSASAPHYSGRPVVRADLLRPDSFRALVDWAAHERRPLVFVLDLEEPRVLQGRLGADGLMAFDWPPRAEVGLPTLTRIWLSDDRDAYRTGAGIRTQRVIAARR